MIDITPEIRKLIAKMMICALVSEVKKNVNVYANITIAGGNSRYKTQTPW